MHFFLTKNLLFVLQKTKTISHCRSEYFFVHRYFLTIFFVFITKFIFLLSLGTGTQVICIKRLYIPCSETA